MAPDLRLSPDDASGPPADPALAGASRMSGNGGAIRPSSMIWSAAISMNPTMDQFIVSTVAADFGYLQCYDLTAWNSGFRNPAARHARHRSVHRRARHDRARPWLGVDPRLRRRRGWRNGAPRIVTDPDPANDRAVRAYEKAGFEKARMVDTPDGPALLMVRDA